jgi:rod shape determining protein RodA
MLSRIWQSIVEKTDGIPWGILLNVYAIISLGLYNLYSATAADVASNRFADQLMFVGAGTIALIFWGIFLDMRTIERYTFVGWIFVCILLVAVDLFGHTTKGSQRWLFVGPVRIQPSEMTKFAVILIVARSFTMVKGMVEYNLFTLWRQWLFVGIPALLIVAQPDLGTAGLCVIIFAIQLLFVRVNVKSIVAVGLIGLVTAIAAWNFFMYDYQKIRVLNFLNPMMDQKGSSYQLLQSMIAVGSGGMWGKGFLQGTQSQLSFLPERHTDFIFSVWAEEHGFVGSMLLIVLLVFLILQIFRIIERSKDLFSSLVAVGVAAFFLAHFVINVTMVVGLFPVVGVPLTLVSYGGSHMLTALSCVGLIVAVERKRVVSVMA